MMRIKTLLCLVLAVLPLVGMWKLEIAGKPQARGQRVPVKTETGTEVLLYAESHALVIGVSEYQRGTGWGTLPGVKDDVPAVRSALEQHGFQVEVVLNPTGSQLRQALNQFAEDWGFAEGNRLVIYFAGHGYTGKTIDGREMGYIVPQDAPDPDQDNARFNKVAVSMKEIMNIAERVQAKHALFLFDSCFSGTLFKTRERVSPSIVQKTARPVREFITAGTARQAVPDQS
ncbi:MAG TPA: caspase family protein, partial [Acidobacteriota bacterium]|nr:caspase family protein [Acidobacteriota bacterium]